MGLLDRLGAFARALRLGGQKGERVVRHIELASSSFDGWEIQRCEHCTEANHTRIEEQASAPHPSQRTQRSTGVTQKG